MNDSPDVNRELSESFDNGKIFDASEEDLNRYLRYLCSGQVKYEMANRCQVITTIKTFRFIDSIQRINKIFTILIIGLAGLTAVLSFYSIRQSHESAKQIERMISTQEQRTIQQKDYFEAQLQEQRNVFGNMLETQNRLIESLVKEPKAPQGERPPSSSAP